MKLKGLLVLLLLANIAFYAWQRFAVTPPGEPLADHPPRGAGAGPRRAGTGPARAGGFRGRTARRPPPRQPRRPNRPCAWNGASSAGKTSPAPARRWRGSNWETR